MPKEDPPVTPSGDGTDGQPGRGPGRAAAAGPWPTRLRRWAPFAGAFALGVVVALLGSLVVAAVRDPDALEVDDQHRTLVVLSGRDDSLNGQRGKLVASWNALHPDQPARIVELSGITDAQRAEMLARAQADDGGVDVYNLDVTWTAEFAEAGHIASLDESPALTAGFLAGPLSTCRYDGRLWALPFNADVGLLYYRPDLLAQIGQKEPPRDWDTLLTDAALVRNRRADVASYVGQFADYEGLTVTALELVWGAGGTVVDDDGRVLPDDRDVTALRTGLDRLHTLAPDLPPALDEIESRREFRAGHALFLRNWPVAYRSLAVQDPEDGAPVPVGVAPLPGGSAALGGQNLAVSSRTTRPRAARALVEFLTSERSEQLLFERGGLSATRDVVYTDELPTPELRAVAPTLRAALDAARARPAVPHYAEFSAAFRSMVDDYLRRGQTPVGQTVRDRLGTALKGQVPPGD